MNKPSFEFNKQLELDVLLNGLTEVTKEYTYDKAALGQRFDDIVIPDGIMRIGDRAFAWWTYLINITIPDSVTSLGDYAFYDCRSLTKLTIPSSVTNIDYGTFAGCSALTNITFEGKTLDEVRSMENYPRGIRSPEKISVQVA